MKSSGATVLAGLILIVLTGARATAQSQPHLRPLTINDAIQTALKHNPRITAARSQLDAAGERVTQARSGFLPQVAFDERFDHTNNPTLAFSTLLNQGAFTQQDFDIQRLNDPDAVDNFNSRFSVVWPLYDSGQTWYGHKQAQLGQEVAALQLQRTRQEVIAKAIADYLNLLLAQKNLLVVHESLKSARANLKMVQIRYQTGFFVKSDLLRAKVRIANLEQQRLQAESNVAVARATLGAVMGNAEDEHFLPVSVLDSVSAPQASQAHWIAQALTRRPDLKQLHNQARIAREAIKKARAAHLPSFNLIGNYEINTEKFSDSADNYTVGAMLNLNLYSGDRISAKVREARDLERAARARIRQLELAVRVQTRQAYLQAHSAWQAISVARTAVDQAAEMLRIVRNRYRNGLVTIVALLDAEVALQKAHTDLFRRLHDYRVSSARLALAAGTIDENHPGRQP